jgi:acetyltransferase-like isoleucine patch superfamily enzyme
MKKINAKEVVIGEDCYIGENVEINVRGKFELGRCSVILDGSKINCQEFIAGEYLFMASGVEVGRGGNTNPESKVRIGDHVGIFEKTIINPNSPVTIGNDVGIGGEVMIWTHGAWLDIEQGYPADFGPVTIGNNVWLPARCIVLPNISIGDDVVIGINSVITKNVPSGAMAAGIPCKVLRENYFPRPFDQESFTQKVNEIIAYWKNNLLPHKGIQSVKEIRYLIDENCILLLQDLGETRFEIGSRKITGYENEVVEDFRDFLRRRGLKIYTGRPFKSINPK